MPSLQSSSSIGLELSQVAIGLITFSLGFFMTFFGRRFLKVLIFCIGFLVGGWISAVSLPTLFQTIGLDKSWDVQSLNHLSMGVAATISICFGLLAHFFWKVAVFFAGCGGGFLIGGWTSLLLPKEWLRTVHPNLYMIGWALVAGILALTLEAYVVMGTSIVCGSYSMVFGLDLFLDLGVADHVKQMTQYNMNTLESLPVAGWALIVAGAVFATAGLLVQSQSYTRSKK